VTILKYTNEEILRYDASILDYDSNPSVWDGITGYYRFDEQFPSSVAVDSFGSNDLTTTYGLQSNSAIHLRSYYCRQEFGSNDPGFAVVDTSIAYDFDIDEPFSFSIWVKRFSDGNYQVGYDPYVFGKGDLRSTLIPYGSILWHGWGLQFTETNEPKVWMIASGGYTYIDSSVQITADVQWHNLIFTYDGSLGESGEPGEMNLWIDGDNYQSHQYIYPLGLYGTMKNPGIMTVGLIQNDPSVWGTTARSNVDEFAIWNRELTESEVATIYNNGSGIFYE